RPVTADTTMSSGERWKITMLPAATPAATGTSIAASAPQPDSSGRIRISGTRCGRMRAVCGGKMNKPLAAPPVKPSGLPPPRPAAMFRRPNRQENHVVDIFDEVDEELREERMQEFLKKYAGLLFAAALLVIGAVGGWKAWGWYEERRDLTAAAN